MLQEKRLMKGVEKIKPDSIIIFCFPFAGGGTSTYSGWGKRFQGKVAVCPLQLPGREEKIMDTPYEKMEELLQDLDEEIRRYCENKMILFGHSMGAKLAYEVGKRLAEAGTPARHLIVSGSRVPHIPEPNPIYQLSDEEFRKEIGRFDGTPTEILENKELLDFFLPMLRADFTMDETYYTEKIVTLSCPITAFGGWEDKEANLKAILKWKHYTENTFTYQMYHGGHFFIQKYETEILDSIEKIIKEVENEK